MIDKLLQVFGLGLILISPMALIWSLFHEWLQCRRRRCIDLKLWDARTRPEVDEDKRGEIVDLIGDLIRENRKNDQKYL